MPNLRDQFKELLTGDDAQCLLDLTTNLGLERVVEEELTEKMKAHALPVPEVIQKPFGFNGHVLLNGKGTFANYWPALQEMHSIQHVIQFLHCFSIDGDEPLNVIYDELLQLDIPDMEDAQSFRLTCNRSGRHSFGSMDVQRIAGAAVQQHYQKEVDLTGYEVDVRLDVHGNACLAGVQKTREALVNRYDRPYLPRVSLKPHIAYGLAHMAQLPGDTQGPILDPFCGAGTVLFEAAYRYPQVALYGSDKFPKPVEGARMNRDAHNLQERMALEVIDALDLSSHYPEGFFEAILTNPPYGLKMAKHVHFGSFFAGFLQEAWKVLHPNGTLVMLVWKEKSFRSQLKRLELFHLLTRFSIEIGGVYPKVYILRKKASQDV